MDLKNILLKRLEEETTYEDAYGLKEVTKVIDEVFKEAETKQLAIQRVSNSFSIIVWNKNQDRPATNGEIDFLINGDDDNGQLFLGWNKVIVTKEDKGRIHLHIDSGEEDNYEIRYVV